MSEVFDKLKIALVHDSLGEYGGAERVLLALHELFPSAPIYTAFYYPSGLGAGETRFKTLNIKTTYLQKIPFYYQLRSPLRILAPHAFSKLDLSAYDLVITSTSAYHAKAIRLRAGAIHICYCHTPARSLYGYVTGSNWQAQKFKRVLGELANHYLRLVDFKTAKNPKLIITNSKITKQRIAKYWRRESVVVYPPVALVDQLMKRAMVDKKKSGGDYYLYVNRLYYAKHPDLAIKACLELKVPLKVVGSGAMLPQLKALVASHPSAGKIEFFQDVDDEKLMQLYQGARALLYPVQDEDFGIVPIEAMAGGTPVIAHFSGGPKETITAGVTGIFFQELTVSALVRAIKKMERLKFEPKRIRTQAQIYRSQKFKQTLRELIQNLIACEGQ